MNFKLLVNPRRNVRIGRIPAAISIRKKDLTTLVLFLNACTLIQLLLSSSVPDSVLIKQAEALLVAQQPTASRPFILGLWSLGRLKPRVLLAVSLTCPRGRGQWLYRSLPRFTRLKRCTPLARLSTSFSHFSTMVSYQGLVYFYPFCLIEAIGRY
ncbi:hypothetical protein BKA70DRAFT_488750 [Coprinopsis sp. MPI-PUGE-AT-0042]|nr:hypothetical protein BKA70DRAFT_488750 [Coprinopsis sp. MPI-PUGE-AT-0042]